MQADCLQTCKLVAVRRFESEMPTVKYSVEREPFGQQPTSHLHYATLVPKILERSAGAKRRELRSRMDKCCGSQLLSCGQKCFFTKTNLRQWNVLFGSCNNDDKPKHAMRENVNGWLALFHKLVWMRTSSGGVTSHVTNWKRHIKHPVLHHSHSLFTEVGLYTTKVHQTKIIICVYTMHLQFLLV